MIAYLNTSALVKLYVEESGSKTVQDVCTNSSTICTSMLAYTETRAAFARAYQDKRLSKAVHRAILEDFHDDWERYFALEVRWEVVRQAGELAEEYRLRAYDAVHLASALHLHASVEEPVSFVCFDSRLNRAAKARGFLVV
ncbi:MAG: twitching motility protein PilT [Nitrospirales bacterium]|nr:MAG: twitching motility protein PilT [Nitrospirales bacterium]